ncbi:hypothetical protein WJN01_04130 [Flavobacteriaceae bacterium SZ-1-7]|uniref:hypothetical protein n=1 Tax=Tamlana sedimenti TaxID=3134126 RepID=UPI00312AFCC9
MKSKIFIISLLTSIVLHSCDCWVILSGNLIDSKTNEPISGAELKFLNIESTDYSKSNDSIIVSMVFKTDSKGHFSMMSNNYGFCPNIEPIVMIQKEGYKPMKFTVKNNLERNGLTVKLEKK